MSCFRWYSPYYPKEILLHTTDSSHYSRILPADTTSTFLPEELVLTSSVHHAMQLPTHFQLQNYIYGCLFHYLKTIWRRTQEGGLQTAYKDVPDVTKLVRRAACLPLLPLNKVEDFWLSHWRIQQWNHYQTEGPRINNHLEGWHNKLKKKVGITHRTIYKLIDEFKKEQAVNEVKIEQYSNGGHKRKRAKKYHEIDTRLATLKTELTIGTKTFIEYGDAASYLLKLGN